MPALTPLQHLAELYQVKWGGSLRWDEERVFRSTPTSLTLNIAEPTRLAKDDANPITTLTNPTSDAACCVDVIEHTIPPGFDAAPAWKIGLTCTGARLGAYTLPSIRCTALELKVKSAKQAAAASALRLLQQLGIIDSNCSPTAPVASLTNTPTPASNDPDAAQCAQAEPPPSSRPSYSPAGHIKDYYVSKCKGRFSEPPGGTYQLAEEELREVHLLASSASYRCQQDAAAAAAKLPEGTPQQAVWLEVVPGGSVGRAGQAGGPKRPWLVTQEFTGGAAMALGACCGG